MDDLSAKREAIVKKQRINDLLKTGQSAFSRGDLDAAERAFRSVLDEFASESAQGQKDETLERYRSEAKEGLVKVYQTGAQNAREAGDFEHARQYYQRWLDQDPQSAKASLGMQDIERLLLQQARKKKLIIGAAIVVVALALIFA